MRMGVSLKLLNDEIICLPFSDFAFQKRLQSPPSLPSSNSPPSQTIFYHFVLRDSLASLLVCYRNLQCLTKRMEGRKWRKNSSSCCFFTLYHVQSPNAVFSHSLSRENQAAPKKKFSLSKECFAPSRRFCSFFFRSSSSPSRGTRAKVFHLHASRSLLLLLETEQE